MNQINQTTTVIKEIAEALIEQVPEFQELQYAKTALENNPAAKKIWEYKEHMRETMEVMRQNDLPISTEQETAYSDKLQLMRDNPLCMRYLKAFNSAKKISGKIGAELNEVIGVDFGPRKGC